MLLVDLPGRVLPSEVNVSAVLLFLGTQILRVDHSKDEEESLITVSTCLNWTMRII